MDKEIEFGQLIKQLMARALMTPEDLSEITGLNMDDVGDLLECGTVIYWHIREHGVER